VVTSRQADFEDSTRAHAAAHFPNIFTAIHFGNHFGKSGAQRCKAQARLLPSLRLPPAQPAASATHKPQASHLPQAGRSLPPTSITPLISNSAQGARPPLLQDTICCHPQALLIHRHLTPKTPHPHPPTYSSTSRRAPKTPHPHPPA
jgi:hypothetical protein